MEEELVTGRRRRWSQGGGGGHKVEEEKLRGWRKGRSQVSEKIVEKGRVGIQREEEGRGGSEKGGGEERGLREMDERG